MRLCHLIHLLFAYFICQVDAQINPSVVTEYEGASTKICDKNSCQNHMSNEMTRKGCVGVYINNESCCPIEHACPDEYQKSKRNVTCNEPSPPSGEVCKVQKFSYNRNKNLCFPGACPQKFSNNIFDTPKECVKNCVRNSDYNICLQEMSPGSCSTGSRANRYFYNHTSNKCVPFAYSGCNGNMNNFATEKECKDQCHDFDSGFCIFGSDKFPKGYTIRLKDPCVICICAITKNQKSAIKTHSMFCIRKTCPPQPKNCRKIMVANSCCPTFLCSEKERGSKSLKNNSVNKKSKSSAARGFIMQITTTAFISLTTYFIKFFYM